MLGMLAVVARKDYDNRRRIEKAKSEGKYSGHQLDLIRHQHMVSPAIVMVIFRIVVPNCNYLEEYW